MNLNVPIELHNSFKSVTASQGENMTDVLLAFIKSYITDHSPKQKKRISPIRPFQNLYLEKQTSH